MTYICVRPQVRLVLDEIGFFLAAFFLLFLRASSNFSFQQETRRDEPRLKRKTESDIDMYSKNIKVSPAHPTRREIPKM